MFADSNFRDTASSNTDMRYIEHRNMSSNFGAHMEGLKEGHAMDYRLLTEAILAANLYDGRDLIQDSWMIVVGKRTVDVFSLSKFVDSFFEILFRHIPSLESVFDTTQTKGELVALILAIIMTLDEDSNRYKEHAQRKLRKLCKTTGIGRPTLLVLGRVLILTVSISIPAEDFTDAVKQAWVRAYIRGLNGVVSHIDRAMQYKTFEQVLKNYTCSDQEFLELATKPIGGFSSTDSFIINSNAVGARPVEIQDQLLDAEITNTLMGSKPKRRSSQIRSRPREENVELLPESDCEQK
ncbi:hypothetical protein SARC_08075 [Sphaeroforma arctica JP610]|uniref:Globin family profile domain-containing protein n=1 Tax=Sphaeroforma arctica JP610 TaxID=667725 RepID=A0A0L0FSG3_9EUKA|nr:hypothetical protein SARC_08075 [Sphaeroforma arctica JP610]KNC79531.1 hypothetical protein SARC_08075 [Sphaeroforma arctica JP610]|eukprot:XP_014153433.1 hypothetical protein SARC_08075 [Sphaeroforma arctica JP610]